MTNKFQQVVHADLEIACKVYQELCEKYEDVRLEKLVLTFTKSTVYFIKYRYPLH